MGMRGLLSEPQGVGGGEKRVHFGGWVDQHFRLQLRCKLIIVPEEWSTPKTLAAQMIRWNGEGFSNTESY
jgi:hypothetical protein